MNYFDNIFNNATMVTPNQAEKIYNSLFLVVVYVVPLLVIIVTYANIILKVFRKAKGDSRPVVVRKNKHSNQGSFDKPPLGSIDPLFPMKND